MKRVRVRLDKSRSYDIIIGDRIIADIENLIKRLRLGNDAVVITNPAIYSIHNKILLKGLKPSRFYTTTINIPDRETSKSNREAVKLIESIVKKDRGKGIFIAAFGGGVVGDVAGFVASIYKRGVPYIQIPTTLLAQVDSSIGGKVAIDLSSAKNLVGAFYQPRIVVSDVSLLKSLPSRQIRSGLAEIIKYGIIEDAQLFLFLERNIDKILKLNRGCLEHVIYHSSRIKAKIVQKDEYDKKGIRARLNYGHTIGHAIETASGYSKRYSHGEAVGIGMIAAAEIAVSLGILRKRASRRIIALIKRAGLPTTISKALKIDRIVKAQSYDKKIIHGVNRFVLPTRIGKVILYEDIPKRLVYEVIKDRYA